MRLETDDPIAHLQELYEKAQHKDIAKVAFWDYVFTNWPRVVEEVERLRKITCPSPGCEVCNSWR